MDLTRSHISNRVRSSYDAAAAIGEALIEIEDGSGQYWSESAQGLLVALIMFEVIEAHRQAAASPR